MLTGHRIESLWAFLAVDDDDDEGIIAVWSSSLGALVPAVGSDEDRVRSLEPAIRDATARFNKPYRLVRFDVRTDIKEVSHGAESCVPDGDTRGDDADAPERAGDEGGADLRRRSADESDQADAALGNVARHGRAGERHGGIEDIWDNQAEGAWPKGARVRKVNSVKDDGHDDGALATVVGSLPIPEDVKEDMEEPCDYFYFVAWDDLPYLPVGVSGGRLERA
jgi:hypothetical protein